MTAMDSGIVDMCIGTPSGVLRQWPAQARKQQVFDPRDQVCVCVCVCECMCVCMSGAQAAGVRPARSGMCVCVCVCECMCLCMSGA